MAINPVLQALLLADQVYIAGDTGKTVIAGTFDCIYAREFPTEFRETYAYVCLSCIHGTVPVKLEYVDLRDSKVLMEYGPISVKSENPLHSVDFAVQVPPLPMPHPGIYALELYAGNEMLGSVRIMVEQIEEEEENENGNEEDDEENYS